MARPDYKAHQQRLAMMYAACVAGTFLTGGLSVPREYHGMYFTSKRMRGKTGSNRARGMSQAKRRRLEARVRGGGR